MQPHSAEAVLAGVSVKAQPGRGGEGAVARRPQTQEAPAGGTQPLLLKRPTVLVLTRDPSLQQLIAGICQSPWAVESRSDPGPSRDLVLERSVRMVILDDEVVSANERGWFFNQINRLAPEAAIIYIASQHSAEVERDARAHRALYYTSKPLDAARLSRMVQVYLNRSWT